MENVVREAKGRLGRMGLRGVNISLEGDRIVLSGRVDSYYHKQLAQESLKGITDSPVKNDLTVNR